MMPENDDLLRIFRKILDGLDPEKIWSHPSEEDYEGLLNSLLETTTRLEDALDWGESYPMTESFESIQLISSSDLCRMAGQNHLIESEHYSTIEANLNELISDYAPSTSISVEQVLAHFSIENQTDLEKIRLRRSSQQPLND
jgi:hypothetical protein